MTKTTWRGFNKPTCGFRTYPLVIYHGSGSHGKLNLIIYLPQKLWLSSWKPAKAAKSIHPNPSFPGFKPPLTIKPPFLDVSPADPLEVGGMPRCFDMPTAASQLRSFAEEQDGCAPCHGPRSSHHATLMKRVVTLGKVEKNRKNHHFWKKWSRHVPFSIAKC